MRPVALITGASSGIGAEFAKLCARDGHDLVLVARNVEALQRLAGELQAAHGAMVTVIAEDLTRPEVPEEVFAELERRGMAVEILINNAGLGLSGAFAETTLTTELQMMQLNMVTPTHLAKLALRDMLRRRRGRILNMASTAAFQPGPLMAVYYATKAYLLSFSEAIAEELRGSGVTVTALCPGPTATQFLERSGLARTRLAHFMAMDPAKVAQIGYRALMRGRRVVIVGWHNTLLAWLVRIAPRGVVIRFARWCEEVISSRLPPRA